MDHLKVGSKLVVFWRWTREREMNHRAHLTYAQATVQLRLAEMHTSLLSVKQTLLRTNIFITGKVIKSKKLINLRFSSSIEIELS